MREPVRSILTWILSAVVVVIAVAVGGEWFIEVAKDKGLYDNAGQHWDAAMSGVREFVTSATVLYPLIGLAGVVGGMWLDFVLKRRASAGAVGPLSPTPTPIVEKSSLSPTDLYHGFTHIDARSTEYDKTVSIVLRFFNGSNLPVAFTSMDGHALIKHASEEIGLPQPSVSSSFDISNIAAKSEFLVAIDQRLTVEAMNIWPELYKPSGIQLDLRKLNIYFGEVGAPTMDRVRLPTWGVVRLRKASEVVQADMVIVAKMEVTLGSASIKA